MVSHFIHIIEYRIKVLPMEVLRWLEMEEFWFCDTAKGRVSELRWRCREREVA